MDSYRQAPSLRGFCCIIEDMTYRLTGLENNPMGLWMLDGTTTDLSTRSGDLTISGTPSYGAPFVKGGGKATYFNNDSYASIPFPFAIDSRTANSFSLEAWVFPQSDGVILGHDGSNDLLLVENGKIVFRVVMSSGTYEVAYTPASLKVSHIVGAYTPGGILLVVDGVEVGRSEFDISGATFTATTKTLISGRGNIGVQAIATYARGLTGAEALTTYQQGKARTVTQSVPALLNGRSYEFHSRVAAVAESIKWNTIDGFPEEVYRNQSAAADGGKPCSGVDENGIYVAGTWEMSVPVFRVDSLFTTELFYKTNGSVTMEYKVNDGAWTEFKSGTVVLRDIADTTGIELLVRASFTAGSYGEVEKVEANIYTTNALMSSTREKTRTSEVVLGDTFGVLEYNNLAGGVLNGGSIILGEETETDPMVAQTLEVWYYLPEGGSLSISGFGSGTAYFDDGQPGSGAYRTGVWTVKHIVGAGTSGEITLSGDAVIGQVSLYPDAFDANLAALALKYYTVPNIVRIDATQAIPVDKAASAFVYSNPWGSTVTS